MVARARRGAAHPSLSLWLEAVADSSRGPTSLGPALPQGRAPSKAQVAARAGCGQHLWNGVRGMASWELQIKPLCFMRS